MRFINRLSYNLSKRWLGAFLLLLILVIPQSSAHSAALYKDCIMAFDYGQSRKVDVTVAPLNRACQQHCESFCLSISDEQGNPLLDEQATCMETCQQGNRYTNASVQGCGHNGVPIASLIYQYVMDVEADAKIRIALKHSDYDNKVYLCGKANKTLTPVIHQIEQRNGSFLLEGTNDDWKGTNHRFNNTGLWIQDGDELTISWSGDFKIRTPNNDHPTLQPPGFFGKDEYNRLIYVAPPFRPGTNEYRNWFNNYTKRGWMHVSTLEILAPGGAINDPASIYIPLVGEHARKRAIWDPYKIPRGIKWLQNYSSPESSCAAIDKDEFYYAQNVGCLRGTVEDRGLTKRDIANWSECQLFDGKLSCGASGSTANFAQICQDYNNSNANRAVELLSCEVINRVEEVIYTYTGKLTGFSSNRVLLGLRHGHAEYTGTLEQKYQNYNQGGYKVDIKWGGCVKQEGENLQYAIVSNVEELEKETSWINFPTSNRDLAALGFSGASSKPVKEEQVITSPKNGSLYLRIKPEAAPKALTSTEMIAKYTNAGYRHGNYQVAIETGNGIGRCRTDSFSNIQNTVDNMLNNQSGESLTPNASNLVAGTSTQIAVGMASDMATGAMNQVDDILTSIVTLVIRIMYGENKPGGDTGIIPKFYKNFVANSNFVQMVRALLALYITSTGFGYLIGVIQAGQRDIVTRIIKVAFVLVVISPTSWEFIGVNLYNAFIQGSLNIIGIITSVSTQGVCTAEQVQQHPELAFATFDSIFSIMTSEATINKLFALISVGGFLAVVACFCAVAAFVVYFIVMSKALVVYLYVLVMIGLLLIIGPIMMIMILFESTKPLFETWWKSLISFSLQPIAMFAAISIFNFLILLLVTLLLGFTVCKSCYLGVTIPLGINVKEICIWPPLDAMQWVPLEYLHFPRTASPQSGFIGIFGLSVTFLLVVTVMYDFVEYALDLANRLIFGYEAHGVSAKAGLGRYNELKKQAQAEAVKKAKEGIAAIKTAIAVATGGATAVKDVAKKAAEEAASQAVDNVGEAVTEAMDDAGSNEDGGEERQPNRDDPTR
jgi:type IV secretory pathway VirB6-like protein